MFFTHSFKVIFHTVIQYTSHTPHTKFLLHKLIKGSSLHVYTCIPVPLHFWLWICIFLSARLHKLSHLCYLPCILLLPAMHKLSHLCYLPCTSLLPAMHLVVTCHAYCILPCTSLLPAMHKLSHLCYLPCINSHIFVTCHARCRLADRSGSSALVPITNNATMPTVK